MKMERFYFYAYEWWWSAYGEHSEGKGDGVIKVVDDSSPSEIYEKLKSEIKAQHEDPLRRDSISVDIVLTQFNRVD